jgi:hypothetical protein
MGVNVCPTPSYPPTPPPLPSRSSSSSPSPHPCRPILVLVIERVVCILGPRLRGAQATSQRSAPTGVGSMRNTAADRTCDRRRTCAQRPRHLLDLLIPCSPLPLSLSSPPVPSSAIVAVGLWLLACRIQTWGRLQNRVPHMYTPPSRSPLPRSSPSPTILVIGGLRLRAWSTTWLQDAVPRVLACRCAGRRLGGRFACVVHVYAYPCSRSSGSN